MLHLWPRLRTIQEERHYLGIDRNLPNLSQITAFAAIMPEPRMGDQPERYPFRALKVVRPNPNNYPPPYYAETELGNIFADLAMPNAGNSQPHLLYSERVADQLLTKLLSTSDAYIEEVRPELSQHAANFMPQIIASERVRRTDMFKLGVAWSESIGRTLISQVIDPTRLDEVQPQDPFVQTNLYVLGSLCEPMASALIWPLIAELVHTLGTRNVVKVVGLFSTGSFAPDATRSLEEAASYAALAELEAFLGVPDRTESTKDLRDLVKSIAGRGAWESRVGKPLFDRIYLVDREKSNQSLASSSLELSVLAANAVEAFLAVDGELFMEQQLGANSRTGRAGIFSVLGAANNYVPLPSYLKSAIEEERKRIAALTILATPDDLDAMHTGLEDLGAVPEESVRSLLLPGTGHMFSSVTRRPWPLLRGGGFRRVLHESRRLLRTTRLRRRPSSRTHNAAGGSPATSTATQVAPAISQADADQWLPEVRVTESFLLPTSIGNQLRVQNQPWRWRALAEAHIATGLNRVEYDLQSDYLDIAWGLRYQDPNVTDNQLDVHLTRYKEQTWAERRQTDSGTIPKALFTALQHVLEDICTGAGGLRRASHRLTNWIESAQSVLLTRRVYQVEQTARRWEEEDQERYRVWQRRYAQVAGRRAHPEATGIRAVLLGLFAAYLTAGWLLTQDQFEATPEHFLIAGTLVVSITLALGLVPWLAWWLSWHRVQRRRIRLAVDRASHLANRLVRERLLSVYQKLRADLILLREPVDKAIEELDRWARPEDPPPIPPLGVPNTHLRVPYTDEHIWHQIKQRLQTQVGSHGQPNPDYFLALWRHDGSNLRGWQDKGEGLPQRIRLSLEQELNSLELPHVIDVEARRRFREASQQAAGAVANAQQPNPAQGGLTTVEEAIAEVEDLLARNAWCGYAAGPPNARPDLRPGCTSCADLRRYSCPFSQAGQRIESRTGLRQSDNWGINAIVHQYLDFSVEHLIPRDRILPGDVDFMRSIIRDYSIERLMFRSNEPQREPIIKRSDQRTNGHSPAGRTPIGTEESNPTIFVEELQARAKPAANAEPAFSTSIVEVDFAVVEDNEQSLLTEPFSKRATPVLASHDPLSVSAIRTVNGLRLQELMVSDRASQELHRLAEEQRLDLLLLEYHEQVTRLYGSNPAVVHYANIAF
jgi:hypothetical protein